MRVHRRGWYNTGLVVDPCGSFGLILNGEATGFNGKFLLNLIKETLFERTHGLLYYGLVKTQLVFVYDERMGAVLGGDHPRLEWAKATYANVLRWGVRFIKKEKERTR